MKRYQVTAIVAAVLRTGYRIQGELARRSPDNTTGWEPDDLSADESVEAADLLIEAAIARWGTNAE